MFQNFSMSQPKDGEMKGQKTVDRQSRAKKEQVAEEGVPPGPFPCRKCGQKLGQGIRNLMYSS